MATAETAWKKTDGPVFYHDTTFTVELGDIIEQQGWFRKRRGTVNYVPGISEPHAEMEFNCLYWVGIAFDDGTLTGVIVNPDSGYLKKTVYFVSRGATEKLDVLPDAPWE